MMDIHVKLSWWSRGRSAARPKGCAHININFVLRSSLIVSRWTGVTNDEIRMSENAWACDFSVTRGVAGVPFIVGRNCKFVEFLRLATLRRLVRT